MTHTVIIFPNPLLKATVVRLATPSYDGSCTRRTNVSYCCKIEQTFPETTSRFPSPGGSLHDSTPGNHQE